MKAKEYMGEKLGINSSVYLLCGLRQATAPL